MKALTLPRMGQEFYLETDTAVEDDRRHHGFTTSWIHNDDLSSECAQASICVLNRRQIEWDEIFFLFQPAKDRNKTGFLPFLESVALSAPKLVEVLNEVLHR